MTPQTGRLPAVKSLYEILPKGTEGGKEFARIVDLLLYHISRREGKKHTVFSDAAGDYCGLDSFGGDCFRLEGTTGYQYKFYPSPLSSNHRKDIESSLAKAAENHEKLKLKKWVLVTPQDLTESATRKDGGDVSWLEGLRKKIKISFELEHMGHTKLIDLFLHTPALCLFYYPALVAEGATRRKSIQDIRHRYDDNLHALYQRIEFVGMSVYKQEATRGVPMEDIYIPLTAVEENQDENDSNPARNNPLSFLNPGSRHVILGDPGSGKSTLMRFLALVGTSPPLQKRCDACPDTRLPILVILRQYADELKDRRNLSILDYIQETIQADFSLKDAEFDFFEYYLESGQGILLFDGLDELPSPSFKKTVRDRITSLLTTYPGNTGIITSRIVGYENPFRFDPKKFHHQRLTKLRLPEMEQFVRDWYKARIEHKKECDDNANDLIRIFHDEEHTAIRELAENPLLLTIVALVHRIDAVLPDERVVLYQKCTETLLNTWHTWKYRIGETTTKRGKTERRNRRRMEAIALWMHCRSVDETKHQRAVVPYEELKVFLAAHITEHEKSRTDEEDPADLADEFLDFVKKKAGLLIEVGDERYSFVHLTFQEYLTASHLITTNEVGGAEALWQSIGTHSNDPRWQEVLRLLIGSLKSNEAQEYLVGNLLNSLANAEQVTRVLLLGGLLLDGIEAAEERSSEILRLLLKTGCLAKEREILRPILNSLRAWQDHKDNETAMLEGVFANLWKDKKDSSTRLALFLLGVCLGWPESKLRQITDNFLDTVARPTALCALFFNPTPLPPNQAAQLEKDFELLGAIQVDYALTSSYHNFNAVTLLAIQGSLNPLAFIEHNFFSLLLSFGYHGPFEDYTANLLLLTFNQHNIFYHLKMELTLRRVLDRNRALDRNLDRDLPRNRARDLPRNRALSRALSRAMARDLPRDRARNRARDLDRDLPRDRNRARPLDQDLDRARNLAMDANDNFWYEILRASFLSQSLMDTIAAIFNLTPRYLWTESLRVGYLPQAPQRIKLLNKEVYDHTAACFQTGNMDDTAVFHAAVLLLIDAWLYVFMGYEEPVDSPLLKLANLTKDREEPPLRIAHCVRDLAQGNSSRENDLKAMVRSHDPRYRKIFEACCWRGTLEEEEREKKLEKAKKKAKPDTKPKKGS